MENGPEGTRTPDLYSAIVALSQLSYRPAAREYSSRASLSASLGPVDDVAQERLKKKILLFSGCKLY